MTPEELTGIEQRAKAATPGPWTPAMVTGLGSFEDLGFIAAARTDVPRLIAEVKRLREALSWYAICDYSHRINAENHAARDAGARARAALGEVP